MYVRYGGEGNSTIEMLMSSIGHWTYEHEEKHNQLLPISLGTRPNYDYNQVGVSPPATLPSQSLNAFPKTNATAV